MITTITRRYHFESAHWLPYVPEWHKCRRVHGHNYEVEITIQGHPNAGFVMDFFELDQHLIPIITAIDHRTLNDVAGLENPTAELIGAWFMEQLLVAGLSCTLVKVFETKDCWATVCSEGVEAELTYRKEMMAV
jgi:6-pyruvoyltetrahydropterin/6-carboxytetrahydropterin synthase